MPRLSFNRAIYDWHNRPLSRQQHEMGETREKQLPGMVGATRFQVVLDLNDVLARRVLELMDEAIASPEIHDAKREAIEQSRRRLVEAFPDLI